MTKPTVLAVPAFKDNYLWLVHDGQFAAAVDPGDAAPIEEALDRHRLKLSAILLTHHHADHIGGVTRLLSSADVPVFGPRHEAIATITQAVGEGERVEVPGIGLAFDVLDVPGHTAGHIAYVRVGGPEHWLFCGDTLFAGGCGRLFEGTPAQMVDSLAKLAALPDDTLVFCAHEYTLSNLKFALAVEPGNTALQSRMRAEAGKRSAGLATVPSTIGLERATNPFLRYREPAIRDVLVAAHKLTSDAGPIAAFAALREWKNTF